MNLFKALAGIFTMVSADKVEDYTIAGINCHSVTGGPGDQAAAYDKVIIFLHGTEMSGTMMKSMVYDNGFLGDITGYKYVFPDGLRPNGQGGFQWFEMYAPTYGCTPLDTCAYNVESINLAANSLTQVINHEKGLVNNDNKNVFLAGFSQGGMMAYHMQLG